MCLAAGKAGKFIELFARRKFAVAVGTFVNVLEGSAFSDGVVAACADFAHFCKELGSVAIGPATGPEPVVDHLVGNRVADVFRAVLNFLEI
ncbi:MAG: hypothetical protein A2583_06865 [Bdellovibrionales bacterium RIFOXYD1_FULL_53_11]|nr:MAG: hypothetical protein A2583_06865 [Bdellovibrionales bacterium RIFOXYD1_FULL_53_11]